MELGLKGKVVLVTGGSKGIGLACAQAFLAEGCEGGDRLAQPRNLERAAAQPGATLSHRGRPDAR